MLRLLVVRGIPVEMTGDLESSIKLLYMKTGQEGEQLARLFEEGQQSYEDFARRCVLAARRPEFLPAYRVG